MDVQGVDISTCVDEDLDRTVKRRLCGISVIPEQYRRGLSMQSSEVESGQNSPSRPQPHPP